MNATTLKRLVVAGFLASITPILGPAAAASTHTHTVALWRLNEGRHTAVAIDSSKYHHKGKVGRKIRTGVRFHHGSGYHWPRVAASASDQRKHIIRVRNARNLDPRRGAFAVSLRFRSHNENGNLIQKGQSGMTGGYWKLDFNHGVLACMFRDSSGHQNTATSLRPINNGKWHTITCKRTAHHVTMFVNGKPRDTHRKRTGSINNSAPLSIGGKRFCGGSVECDYWWGDLDWVKIKSR